METDGLRQEADDLQRQRLEVYRSHVAVPWAWPVLGVAVFLVLSSFEVRSPWLPFVALVSYLVFIGAWTSTIITRAGVQPRFRGMPRPLIAESVRFGIGYALVMAAMMALGLAWSFLLAGALAGMATVVGGRTFERRYRRRADALVAGSTRSR